MAAESTVTRIDVTGMMCTKSCTPTVQKALEEVDGVESVNVNLDGACAFVMGTADPAKLVEAVLSSPPSILRCHTGVTARVSVAVC